MHQWFLLVGLVLVGLAISAQAVERLPVSPAMLYLLAGAVIGPAGLGWVHADPIEHAAVIEVLAEIAVLVTLFSVGLRLDPPPQLRAWRVPLLLAGPGMIATIGMTTLGAVWLLDCGWGVALLIAAILAPTDPVLASELQIRRAGDRDAVRLALTAEGGLNDGAAFPALMLALGLLGHHSLGPWGIEWILRDLLWACGGGLVIGWTSGLVIAAALRRLRHDTEPAVLVEFLVPGTIALSYGVALALNTYGFLAVFAGGLALARSRSMESGSSSSGRSPRLEAAIWTRQAERVSEIPLVMLVGVLIGSVRASVDLFLFALLLLAVIRPAAVAMTVPRHALSPHQRRLVGWFGIRGIGSLYYLSFAVGQGVGSGASRGAVDAVLVVIGASIIAHGISATPLMNWYESRRRR